MAKGLVVSEIFGPTLQGEGAYIGHKTIFVRLGGCDFRCQWCDTLYSVSQKESQKQGLKEWEVLSEAAVLQRIQNLEPSSSLRSITISGGNPALQDLEPLLLLCKQQGYHVAMETQGSLFCSWFSLLDVLTLSPKPPSSGMVHDIEVLKKITHLKEKFPKDEKKSVEIVLKIAVSDEKDFDFAVEMKKTLGFDRLYLQPVNSSLDKSLSYDESMFDKLRWLSQKAIDCQEEGLIVLPQLHLYLWGGKPGY